MSVFEQKEEWLLARTRGIGGSDIAAIVGMSPFKRPIDIFIGKTEKVEFSPDFREFIEWGNLLEPVIRQEYERRSGQSVASGLAIASMFPGRAEPWDNQTIVRAEKHPWRLGTPDGIHLSHNSGLEVKNSGFKGEGWGKSGTDEIPDHYMIQCQWYMGVTDRPSWDVAVLFSGNRLEIYRVRRNDDLLKELVDAGAHFWNDNVLKRIPPAIDESEAYGKYLARKFSLSNEFVLPASDEINEWAAELKIASEQKDAAEAKIQLAKNHLGALIGEYKKTETAFGSVNWIRPKQGKRTNWEAVAIACNPSPELVKQHTTPVENSAYVRAYWQKEK